MSAEYLIPFLIIIHQPVNYLDLNSAQVVYNVSHTWVHEFEYATTVHGHMVAQMTCVNLNYTSLLCQLVKPSQRTYTEGSKKNPDLQNLKYEPLDCKVNKRLCDTFELRFDRNGLKDLVVPKDTELNTLVFLRDLSRLLNIFWIDVVESEDGLVKIQDQSNYGKCVAVMKITKERLPSTPKKKFEIDSVSGFNGMKFNYKKTRDVQRCSNKDWTRLIPGYSVDTILKSSIDRVIVSPHEFVSLIENEITMSVPDLGKVTNVGKVSITLSSIEEITNKIERVVDPVYKSIY